MSKTSLKEFRRPGLWIGNVWYPDARAEREIAVLHEDIASPDAGDEKAKLKLVD